MTNTHFRAAAFAVLAFGAGLAVSQASAQDRFARSADDAAAYARPAAEEATVPPNAMGQYTCGFNEPHSHLERQTCGGVHYRY